MLQAMNTGHDGSLTTIHANTPRDALSRVETLVLTGGVELPLKAIREQIASAFDMVVQVSRLVDGTRRITHITEVLRMESDVVTLQDLFIAKPARGRRGGRSAGAINRLLGPMQRDRHQAAVPQQARRERRAPAAAVLPARARARQRSRRRARRPSAGPRHEARARARQPASRPCSRSRSAPRPRRTPRVQIAQVDTSRYPLITATVIAPNSDKLKRVDAATPARTASAVTTTQSGGGVGRRDRRRDRRQPLDGGRPARRRQARPQPRS